MNYSDTPCKDFDNLSRRIQNASIANTIFPENADVGFSPKYIPNDHLLCDRSKHSGPSG